MPLDPLTSAAGSYLISMGLPGIAFLVLLYAVWQLRKDNQALNAALTSLQDQRVTDAREQTRALMANTAATEAQTQAFRDLSQLIIAGRRNP